MSVFDFDDKCSKRVIGKKDVRESKVSSYVGLGARRRIHEARKGGDACYNQYAHRIHN